MKIYIIRHGETESNREGRLQGWTDDPLNQNGIRLAELTGQKMKDICFDAAFSSPLTRARKTADIILKQCRNSCPVMIDDRIKEIGMGELEGKRFKGPDCEVDPELVKAFFDDPVHMPEVPGGERVTEVVERTQSFLKELAETDYTNVLVSTHGCALRCMLNFLYDDPSDFWHGHVPYNCVVNIVEAEDGKMKLTGDDVVLYDEKYCIDRYGEH